MTASPHVLLFDLYAGGHHGQYVRHLLTYWGAKALPGRLSVVAPPSFFDLHGDVRALVDATAGIEAVPIDEPVDLDGGGTAGLIGTDRTHGRLFRRYARALRPTHAVLMYLDHAQLSLATDLRLGFPLRLSGIYFRPSFHYGGDGGATSRLQRWRKRLVLAAALRNPHLTHLFCLDPLVVPHVAAMNRRVSAVALPDGVASFPALPPREALHARWGVEPGRRPVLFFGSIDARKGIHEALEALPLLAPGHQRAVCLVLAGRLHPGDAERVHAAIDRLRTGTAVQVVLEDRFVDEEEIAGIMAAADLALLPYQRHIGSSGVLIRAAGAGVPVLGSDYGLLGEHTRRHRLGLAVDTTSPAALADGLAGWLRDPDAFPFDYEQARRFAADNTDERFAATLFDHLLG